MTEASRLRPIVPEPLRSSYDVVIIGGAVMGSSVAWFLSANPDFDGSVLVVERDGSYDFSSTSRTQMPLCERTGQYKFAEEARLGDVAERHSRRKR